MFPVAGEPDAVPTDATDAMDAGGEQVCGGRHRPTALFRDCVTAAPEVLTSTPAIDTGAPGSMGDCTQVIAQEDAAHTELCVIAAHEIQIGTTIVVGSRPLLLASATTLTVAGVLTVASPNGALGAGANFASCSSMLEGNGAPGSEGAGGGAGGSFATVGGNGGFGFGNHAGGFSELDTSPVAVVRGGCPGGKGGNNDLLGNSGGLGGNGGGAIYLLATASIVIENRVDASGGGGFAGLVTPMGGGGGGGGGSGGLIALDAAEITVVETARLIANGGGGGAGGPPSPGPIGMNGESPDPTGYPFIASGGQAIGAGNGGPGGNAEQLAAGNPIDGGDNFTVAGGGGGGGGGGLGYIYIFGPLTNKSVTASPNLSD